MPPPENVRGDFDGDGRSDVPISNTNLLSYLEADGSPNVNGDGNSDLLWKHTDPSNGTYQTWLMDGFTVRDSQIVAGVLDLIVVE